MAMKWREDKKPTESSFGSGVMIVAENILAKDGVYDFVIYHVRTPQGKGFMPSIRDGGRVSCYGTVVYGTDEDAYETARADGKKLLRDAVANLKQAMDSYRPGNGF